MINKRTMVERLRIRNAMQRPTTTSQRWWNSSEPQFRNKVSKSISNNMLPQLSSPQLRVVLYIL